MNNWLRAYEDRRTDPYTSRKELLSSRFDLSGLSWDEIRAIPIPELGEDMTFGRSFEALRKTWYSYKRNKKDGFQAPDLCYRILKIQRALGPERISPVVKCFCVVGIELYSPRVVLNGAIRVALSVISKTAIHPSSGIIGVNLN